tara:strand:+ start:917 stop:1210 length:294 start_codon:yes stop_codon:yes gene_type:complete
MSNKKKKTVKKFKKIEYRTQENRKEKVKELIKELSKFELNPKYEPIKELYKQFRKYIDTGDRIIINIPFPMINRRIKGTLANTVNEEVTIALKHEKF